MEYFETCIDPITQQILKARSLAKPVSWTELEQKLGVNRTRLQNLERRGLQRLRMLMSNPLDNTPLGHVGTNDSQGGAYLSRVPKWYVP